ncbi:D-alanine--D-alanine ligase [Lactiplantibacillus plantarum]|nr:D-alanine--D-alanine ligase [Lactiplantibacillus plantarum]
MYYKMTKNDFNELIKNAHRRFQKDHRLVVVANVVGQTKKRDSQQPDSDFFSPQEITEIDEALQTAQIPHEVLTSELDFNQKILDNKIIAKCDIIWNLTRQGGSGNKKSLVTSLADFNRIPYIGSSVEAMAVCRDKNSFEQLIKPVNASIPTYTETELASFSGKKQIILKNASGSASIGLSDDSIQSMSAFEVNHQIKGSRGDKIAEQFIQGFEVEVPVFKIGSRKGRHFKALSPVGISFDNQRFLKQKVLSETRSDSYNYQFYSLFDELFTQEHIDTGLVESRLINQACRIAERLSLSNYARIDFRVTLDGNGYCFDIASTPYLIKHSSPVWGAAQLELTQAELITAILGTAD